MVFVAVLLAALVTVPLAGAVSPAAALTRAEVVEPTDPAAPAAPAPQDSTTPTPSLAPLESNTPSPSPAPAAPTIDSPAPGSFVGGSVSVGGSRDPSQEIQLLSPTGGDLVLSAQSLHNEMHHFTANRPDGAGFAAVLAPVVAAAAGRRLWLKGHGTGTLEAGRLESTALARAFPGAPLVSWKGSLGHTLGSCGLVELAVAAAALRTGRTPGTVGSGSPTFTDTVALAPFATPDFAGVVCASNAFGGAHGALLLSHA